MASVLVAHDLYRFFHVADDETLALRGVSLSVDAGEMVAITGPSGSGKSTLLACLAGLDEPDGGVVYVEGERLTRRSEAERAGRRARSIGMVFQSGNLLEHLSVAQNIAFAQRLAPGAARSSVTALLRDVGLGERAQARPSHLSGGEVARAGLAIALANSPVILLADEPTGELDAASADRVLGLLRRRTAAGSAVVVVTHSAPVAAAADREVQLLDGVIVA